MAATHEQLREGFDRWLSENPNGLKVRGRNHSQTYWPKEWGAAGYKWFPPPVCKDPDCPRRGQNMGRATSRPFSFDDGTSTIVITFICNSRDGRKPHYAFRTVAGEIAKPIGGGRGRGGVYEIEREGKVLRTRSQASPAAVVAHQKKRRAAREAAEHQERVALYGPEVAEKWPSLTQGEKLSLNWHRTPERHEQWASSVGQAQRRPEMKALRSKVSKEMWSKRAAQRAELDQRVSQAERDAIEARRLAEEAVKEATEKEAAFAVLTETAKKAWRPAGFDKWPLWQQRAGEYFLTNPGLRAPEVGRHLDRQNVPGPWGNSTAAEYARTKAGEVAFYRVRKKLHPQE